jgi:hypothetical protein
MHQKYEDYRIARRVVGELADVVNAIGYMVDVPGAAEECRRKAVVDRVREVVERSKAKANTCAPEGGE